MRRGAGVGTTLIVTVLLAVHPAEAQRHRRAESAGQFDLSFIAAAPTGELGYFFDQGFGAQFGASYPIDELGHVRLRADFGFLVYGIERQNYCFALPFGCRLNASLTTSNNIAFGGIGPEIVLMTGPVQPYLHASGGFSTFFTTSSLGDDDEYGDSFSTTHLSDVMFAWRAGGGVRVRVANGRKPVSLDFGVERHENGTAEFLRKGDVVDHPDGSITIYPNQSEANLVTFRFGVSIGIPRHGGRN